MKKIFFLFFMTSLFTNLYGQKTSDFDNLITDLDKSKINTNILYNTVDEFAALSQFNAGANISNYKHFQQILNNLFLASNKDEFISYKDLKKMNKRVNQNEVNIGIINSRFNSINYDANNLENSALVIENGKFKISNESLPVFNDDEALVASTLQSYINGKNVIFNLNEDFIFQNQKASKIQEMKVDFGDGLERLVIQNGVLITSMVSVTYADYGKKKITMKAVLENGKELTTFTAIENERGPIPGPPVLNASIDSNIPFQGYDETYARRGKLDYRVFFSDVNGSEDVIKKPIIIIDGFDPQDKRQIEDSDPHPGSSNEEHISIDEMMSYIDASGSPKSLRTKLMTLGFDVIIVNHPIYESPTDNQEIDGGADFIERNALTHVALYQEINQQLVNNNSTEELVIVGPSMGGQISRYALAYMEKNNIPHNTRLWISVDSPHLGANISMGAQSLVNTIYDEENSVGAIDFVENSLGSAAAKQQLIDQYNGHNNEQLNGDYLNGKAVGQGFAIDRGHPFFVQYYNNLNSNGLPNSSGYPQNLRKISIVNGSLIGSDWFDNPFQNNSLYLNQNGTTPDSYASASEKVLKLDGHNFGPLGHLVTIESYNSAPTGADHKISYFKKKKIGGWDYHHRYMTNNNNRGSLDILPGGWFPTQGELAKSTLESESCDLVLGVPVCVNAWDIVKLKQIGSFIPVVSALGLKNPNTDWGQAINRDLVCTNETPFDTYFGPKKNEQHTSFTQASVDWLEQELLGNDQPPTVYLMDSDLIGAKAVCRMKTNNTFSFGLCTPPVSSWEVSSNLYIQSSTSSSITVKPFSELTSQAGFIRAIFPNNVVEKYIWVGKPATAPGITALTQNFPDSPVNYRFELEANTPVNQGEVKGLDWDIFPAYMVDTSIPDQLWIDTPSNAGVYLDYYLKFQNECGWSPREEKHGISIDDNGQGGGGQASIPIYPNIADHTLYVDLSDAYKVPHEISIFDVFANKMISIEANNSINEIDVSDLNTGVYFVNVFNGRDTVVKKILVE